MRERWLTESSLPPTARGSGRAAGGVEVPAPPRPSRHGPTRPRGCPRPAALGASAPPHPPPHGPPRSPPLTPSAVLPPTPTRLSRPCSNVATPSKVLRGSRSPPQTAPVPGCGSSPRTRSGAWAGLSRRTASLRAAPPRPLRGSRCPECWGCTGSASDRPAMTSEGAPPAPRGPAASPTPYLTQQRRQLRFTAFPATAAKGAVKRRAVAAPVVVGDHRAALPRASARPRLRPRPPRSLKLSCLLPSHRSAR